MKSHNNAALKFLEAIGPMHYNMVLQGSYSIISLFRALSLLISLPEPTRRSATFFDRAL